MKFRHGRNKSKRIAKFLKAINAGKVHGYRYNIVMLNKIRQGTY